MLHKRPVHIGDKRVADLVKKNTHHWKFAKLLQYLFVSFTFRKKNIFDLVYYDV